MTSVYVPATIGNIGPGFDVLGIAIEGLGDTITFKLNQSHDEILSVGGMDSEKIPLNPDQNSVVIAARSLFNRLGQGQRYVTVSLDRQLPVAGGMGSSAAASVAGALAASELSGLDPANSLILEAALDGESFCAGRHLDNIAPCFLGGLTGVLCTETPKPFQLPIQGDWWFSLVTPDISVSTRDARKVLPESLPQKDWVEVSSRTLALAHAFGTGDYHLMSHALQDPYAEPRRSSLIPGFAAVKSAAIHSGAIACSISGAGPTIFAISDSKATATKVLSAMTESIPGPIKIKHIGQPDLKGARVL